MSYLKKQPPEECNKAKSLLKILQNSLENAHSQWIIILEEASVGQVPDKLFFDFWIFYQNPYLSSVLEAYSEKLSTIFRKRSILNV